MLGEILGVLLWMLSQIGQHFVDSRLCKAFSSAAVQYSPEPRVAIAMENAVKFLVTVC